MKNRMFCQTIQRFQQTINHVIGSKLAFGAMLALFILNGLVSAQSGPAEFVPFRNFIDQTTTANADDYLGKPASNVKDAAAFEEMRQHILNMYDGVEVNHSFLLDSAYYDCVPVMQQPAVRKYGIKKIATPPPTEILDSADDDAASGLKRALQADSEKQF